MPNLNLNPKDRDQLNRAPFGFNHDLSGLSLFSPQNLRRLAERYNGSPADYYIASSAEAANSPFYASKPVGSTPAEALEQLDTHPCRILLKRVDQHDEGFRELLQSLFRQVLEFSGTPRNEKVKRLESGIFITSTSNITPCHFDPEINFFSQIRGKKIYHVYPPATVTEEELERFYVAGRINIAEIDLLKRDRTQERTFELEAGKGLYHPQNSPHWVETTSEQSVSYSFVFETASTRASNRIRAYNHYLRQLGLPGRPPGQRPEIDTFKHWAMRVVTQARKAAGKL